MKYAVFIPEHSSFCSLSLFETKPEKLHVMQELQESGISSLMLAKAIAYVRGSLQAALMT